MDILALEKIDAEESRRSRPAPGPEVPEPVRRAVEARRRAGR